MDNDKKLRAQARGIKAANTVIDQAVKLTNYSSYHAYRRSLRLSNYYLLLAFLLALYSLIPIKANSHGTITSLVFIMLLAYFFLYYWIMAKAAKLKRDSDHVMLQVAFNGLLSEGWSIYDGIADDPGQESLEITFTKERPLLTNIWYLAQKKKQTLPLPADDILNLKYYLAQLTNISKPEKKYVAYATLDDGLVEELTSSGIRVDELPRKYKTKPGRWNYAVATGIATNALLGYPHFSAYMLSVDPLEVFQEVLDETSKRNSKK